MKVKCIKNTWTETKGIVNKVTSIHTYPLTIGKIYDVDYKPLGYGYNEEGFLVYDDLFEGNVC